MKTLNIIALATTMGLALPVAQTTNAQQIVEMRIGNANPIHLTQSGYFAIGYIDVPQGRWIISGQINFWEIGQTGTVFAGANASVGEITLPTDGTSGFDSATFPTPTNQNLHVTIPTHVLQVGNDPRIYLVAWSNSPHQPPPNCYAWGSLFAERVGGGNESYHLIQNQNVLIQGHGPLWPVVGADQ